MYNSDNENSSFSFDFLAASSRQATSTDTAEHGGESFGPFETSVVHTHATLCASKERNI
jgi:hypothetical protein